MTAPPRDGAGWTGATEIRGTGFALILTRWRTGRRAGAVMARIPPVGRLREW
ncbi:hypothetical protein ACIBTV_18670 [Micromonospora sp. NPDC049366]|uniref:hypothetical protein n=1 Tax=Micromonospora sp. NPDC049366 TaxID=3364271 RepID=UPI00378D8580